MARKHYSGPVSDHFDGIRFFVPGHVGDKSRRDLMKWSFSGKRVKWPKFLPAASQDKPPARVDGIRSTLIGHASFLLQIAGVNLLIDPVFGKRASPVPFAGPRRANEPGIAYADLPEIDAVLITHNHYDHFDKPLLWRLEQEKCPRFIGPLGVDGDLMRRGKKPGNITALDWGDHCEQGGLTIHAVPTYHWSARGLGDRRKSLWCSFVITSKAGKVYHIGDTGYGAGEFSRNVAQKFGVVDLVHIPIGAYEPRWFMKDFHVNPQEAVQIFQDCEAKAAIGHHWGTFQLTDEGHDQPERDLALALERAALDAEKFKAFRPGDVWSL